MTYQSTKLTIDHQRYPMLDNIICTERHSIILRMLDIGYAKMFPDVDDDDVDSKVLDHVQPLLDASKLISNDTVENISKIR